MQTQKIMQRLNKTCNYFLLLLIINNNKASGSISFPFFEHHDYFYDHLIPYQTRSQLKDRENWKEGVEKGFGGSSEGEQGAIIYDTT